MLKVAKSEQLFQLLKDKVADMRNGERFPSVRQLMREYSVSQFTVAPALDLLEERKLISREVGKGTFVRKDGEQKPFTLYYFMHDWNLEESFETERMCQEIARERNYTYRRVVYSFSEDIYSKLPFGEADAIIINPVRSDLTPEQVHILQQAPIPVIMIRSTLHHLNLNSVGGNNAVSGTMAAEYFLKNGHRKLAMLLSEPFSNTSHELLDSFSACARANDAELTVINCNTVYGENSQMKAYSQLCRWLQENPVDFTAMAVTSDFSALGALRAMSEFGLKVPRDVSVLGIGSNCASALFNPSLSVVMIPVDEMIKGAFELIDQIIEEKADHAMNYVVYPRLVKRESSGKNLNI